MPTKICRKCGGTTNTAVCDWIGSKDDKADRCYAKWEDGKWIKGCCYDAADCYTKPYIDKMVAEGTNYGKKKNMKEMKNYKKTKYQ